MKKLYRASIYLGILLVMVLAAAAWYVYNNQDEIIDEVISELNQAIDTPIEAESIDLTLFKEFPSITLRLKNVKIHQSSEVLDDYLCIATDVFITVRLKDLISKDLRIDKITVKGAVINTARDINGNSNYRIFSKKDTATAGSFMIRNLSLYESEINYTDLATDISVRSMTDKLVTRIHVKKGDIILKATGKMTLKKLDILGSKYFENTQIEHELKLTYHPRIDEVRIVDAQLEINGFPYDISGKANMGESSEVDFTFQSPKSDIQSIISLLPEKYRNYLWPYKSKGIVYFQGSVKGILKRKVYPSIKLEFGAKDASIYHPDYKTTLDHLHFKGSYTNGTGNNLRTSVLSIDDFDGLVDGKKLSGRLTLRDFNRLLLDADISSDFDLPSFFEIFPNDFIKNSRGRVLVNLNFNGPVNDIEKNIHSNLVNISGDVIMNDVSIITKKPVLGLDHLNGNFIFNNRDLAIVDFQGRIGSSDFLINGFFKNVIAWLFVKDYPVRIEAEMESKNIDLNELLRINFDTPSAPQNAKTGQYYFTISPRLDILFKTQIDNVYFKRFHGRNIRGDLIVNNRIAVLNQVNMEAMGGELELSGSVMSRNRDMREILVDGRVKNLRIDSIFYVFKNFNQSFIKSDHLYGDITADVNTYVLLDRKLKFYPDDLSVYIDATIENGQLNNFDPMQNLKQYVHRDDDLSRLRFGNLHNVIEVKDKTVYIPRMMVESNVSKLYLQGTHTFDQEIEYHFQIPINQKERKDADERFGEVETGNKGEASIFLKMAGTTDQYKVSHDTKAVKKKIREDIRKEGREFKKAFSKKDTSDIESIELDDEYIDYE